MIVMSCIISCSLSDLGAEEDGICSMYLVFHSAAEPARKRDLDAGREVVISVTDTNGGF